MIRGWGPAPVVVFAVALALRAGALAGLSSPLASAVLGRPAVLGSAIDGYHEIGLQLAQGRGFSVDSGSGPTAARAPLYPLLLAALYRMFGAGPVPVLWVQAVLGALTCALVCLLGSRMFDRATGLVAGLLFALYPPHLAWSWSVIPETLLVLLLTASGYALVGLAQVPSPRRALLTGAWFGLTALCNPVILLLPLAIVVLVAPAGGLRRRYLRPALVLLAATWAVVLPWTARNYARFREPIPVSWGAGWTYVKGLFMVEGHLAGPTLPMWRVDQAATVETLDLLRRGGFGESPRGAPKIDRSGIAGLAEDDFLRRWASRWIRENPLGAARKFAVNLWLYWFFSGHGVYYLMLNVPLVALALLGLGLGAWRTVETRVVVLFVLYFYLMYAVMMACARYSLQVMPFVSVLAAAAVVGLARRAAAARGATE